MPAQWIAEVIGKMHIMGITQKEVAAYLGYCPEYVSVVLNGKRSPKNAESKFRKAVEELSKECG